MPKLLVIADTHIRPSYDSIYQWSCLARYCLKTKPDYIIHLGDVADLDSQARLISNRGLYSLEEELKVVEHTLEAFHNVFKDYNNKQRQNKKKMYRPHLVLTLGNHDVRNGITHIQELFESFGWSVYPYLEPVLIEGITFVHCMHRGLSDSICTTAQELLENWHGNIVVGHGHHKDFFESFSMATRETITALRSPCFMSEVSNWAVQTNNKWSKGFTEIEVNPFNFVWRNMECLYKI